MSEATRQAKPTQGHHLQGRGGGRSAGHKVYASEGDMAPHTPEKRDSPVTNNTRVTSAKQRTKNKPRRMKDGLSTSPQSHQPDQHTPQQPVSVKGPTAAAYAGATFHASPAPSALPMPSFLSKATNASPTPKNTVGVLQQPSPPATDADADTPQRSALSTGLNESPLDFMFRAHRKEKEQEQKRHEFSGMETTQSATPPSNPPFDPSSSYVGLASSALRQSPTRHASSGGIDGYELDGHAGQPTGPAFSTPYQDRIKAARPTQNRLAAGPDAQYHAQDQPTEDPTEALKKFLFGSNEQSSSASSIRDLSSRAARPEGTVSSSSSIAGPQGLAPDAHRGNKIQAMENDLRRILNIKTAPTAHKTERRLFTQ